MIPLHRLIAVELFKLRRTLALFVALVLPGVIALLYALMLAQRGKAFMGLPEQAWNALFQANLSGWVMLGLTLFVALEAALVVGVEHQHGGWKRLFAAPIDATRLFAAKTLVVFGLVLVSLASLWFWTVVFGNFVALAMPELAMPFGAPDAGSLILLAKVAAASTLIVALHVAIAARWPAIAVSLGSGIVAMIGLVIAASSKWMKFYPWFFPLSAAQADSTRALAAPVYAIAALVALVVVIVAARSWRSRDVP
ncbi:MAG TPA: ABC transporter permease [Pseudomonadota bacterium]|jgi:hypothetical protein|nr:ABC transporter permease [Pseudomonadota bacterium]